MKKTHKIVIRDPFVLPDPDSRCYWLYGTTGGAENGYPDLGFYGYRSKDLENWEGPFPVFLRDADFWGTKDFWAPEVHFWNGRYYMFASFKSENRCRGTQILTSSCPQGPFQPLTRFPVTPSVWECLDGTLYVDEQHKPWIVFCHEWVQIADGSMEAMPLSGDLKTARGKPVTLFHASENPHVTKFSGKGYVTDGPFLFRAGQTLCMIWASFHGADYIQCLSVSPSGKITGPWEHKAPVFDKDGGHGMIFQTFEGERKFVLHQPNHPKEHPVFLAFPQCSVPYDGR